MLNNREEGQAGSPRSPHKHGKRTCWGISLLVPSEARPPEVIKGRLYVGSRAQAQNWTLLQSLGITHILNVSRDSIEPFEGKVKYLQCGFADKEDVDISVPAASSWEFIESAFEDASSCVLVHCASGVSRSVTIIIYYLMRKEIIPCEAALQRIRSIHPAACPNRSFISQLTALNSSLAPGALVERTPSLSMMLSMPFSRESLENGLGFTSRKPQASITIYPSSPCLQGLSVPTSPFLRKESSSGDFGWIKRSPAPRSMGELNDPQGRWTNIRMAVEEEEKAAGEVTNEDSEDMKSLASTALNLSENSDVEDIRGDCSPSTSPLVCVKSKVFDPAGSAGIPKSTIPLFWRGNQD